MCHRVGGVWLFFVFWVEHLLSQAALVVVCARVRDDFKRLCFPLVLVGCWCAVGCLG